MQFLSNFRQMAMSFQGKADRAARHHRTAVRLDPEDADYAEQARKSELDAHWLLWPLRPVNVIGIGPTFVFLAAAMGALMAAKIEALAMVVFFVYFVMLLEVGIVRPLIRRRMRKRRP